MLRAHLCKEWRELRWMVWACIGLLLLAPVGLAWAVPLSAAARLPWFGIALFVAAVTLGTEVVVGDARRRQHDWLARLPGGLRAAFCAKTGVLLLSMVVLGAAGWGGEVLGDLIRLGRLWGSLQQRPWLAAWAALLAVWLMASACWRPHGASALTVTLVLPAVFLAPLVWLSVDKPGIAPVALDLRSTAVYGIGAGLALAWFGFRRFLAFPRERRRLRTSAAAAALVFAPLWIQGGCNVWRWHHVDPTDEDTRIASGFVGSGGRHAYLNLAKEVVRGKDVYYSVRADLTDGSWQQVGQPQSTWNSLRFLDRGFPIMHSGSTTPLVLRTQHHDAIPAEFLIDAASGEVFDEGSMPQEKLFQAARQLTGYRLDDGTRAYVLRGRLWVDSPDGERSELPWHDGDYPDRCVGRGFRVPSRSDHRYRYFDLTRRRLIVYQPDQRWWQTVAPLVRRGAWIAQRPTGPSLFWPETGEYGPIQGMRDHEEIGPLVDDHRVLTYRKGEHELWLLDPETGERTPVSLTGPALDGIRAVAGMPFLPWSTPAGTPVVQLHTVSGLRVGRMKDGSLACTAAIAEDMSAILALPDEETALVIVGGRTVERLRFGSDTRDVLFPRSDP